MSKSLASGGRTSFISPVKKTLLSSPLSKKKKKCENSLCENLRYHKARTTKIVPPTSWQERGEDSMEKIRTMSYKRKVNSFIVSFHSTWYMGKIKQYTKKQVKWFSHCKRQKCLKENKVNNYVKAVLHSVFSI